MQKSEKIIKYSGIMLILFAFLANPFVIEYLFSPDKKLDFLWKYAVIIIFESFVLILGLLLYFKPGWTISSIKGILLYAYFSLKSRIIGNLKIIKIFIKKNKINILLSLLVIIAILFLFEFFIRFCLFNLICNVPSIKNPLLYTKYQNEDFWLLVHEIQKPWWIDANDSLLDIHPLLGWDLKKNINNDCYQTDENGAQIYKTKFDDSTAKILFFGNSFTQSISCSNNTISAKLEKDIGIDTLNLGIGGYGFDQIFLKFNLTYKKFNNSTILIGLLYDDLDRSILKGIINNQKPYFEIKNNELILRGVPVSEDPEEIFNKNKPQIRSYLFNLFYYSDFGFDFFKKLQIKEEEQRKRDIKNINKGILNEIINIKNKNNLTIYFVLFYSEYELTMEDWRHGFFKNLLKKNNISYFDTKKYLLDYSSMNNVSISDFYRPVKGHHNDLGNTIIAKGISGELKELIKNNKNKN